MVNQSIEWKISPVMQTAAKSVALTHSHYVGACRSMASNKGNIAGMTDVLEQRKKAHSAYHIALAFLKRATIAANPYCQLPGNPALQAKLQAAADIKLNQLIADYLPKPLVEPHFYHHILEEAEAMHWA